MSVFIGAIKGESAIQKRVAEVNAMINEANSKGIVVFDRSSTWQSAMMYRPIKFSRGVLFVSWQTEDLYKKVKTGKSVYTKQSVRIPSEDAKAELTYIARMYRTALRYT